MVGLLSSLLCGLVFSPSAAQCSEIKDESVIQNDTTEPDFQLCEEKEENLESTNIEHAEGLLDEDMSSKNDSQIQVSYKNKWRGPLRFTCTRGRALNHVESKHSKRREDRRWHFSCKRVSALYVLLSLTAMKS